LQVRAYPRTPRVEITASDLDITPHAGLALVGPMLDRLGLEPLIDERLKLFQRERGYTEGELCRAIVETQVAGGDFCSDVRLLAAPATRGLRGDRAVPDPSTLTRFLRRATIGTATALQGILSELLRRAWRAGAGPEGEVLYLDLDSTIREVHGPGKQGASFAYTGEVALPPLLAVVGNSGEVAALRLREGRAHPARGAAHFLRGALRTVMEADPSRRRVWVRADSAFYSKAVVRACQRVGATFTITAPQRPNVAGAIEALATAEGTCWCPATGMGDGSEVAETPFSFGGQELRLIVRRTPRAAGDQLAFDDAGAYRYQALITNATGPAAEVEEVHRGRGGACEEAIRELKGDFGLAHLPVASFFGNWVWAILAAVAYDCSLWLKTIALPRAFRRARPKGLRLWFLNLAARLVRSGRRLLLRLPKGYPYLKEFRAAYHAVLLLPSFG
jgi:hypothetical protein